MTRGTKGLVCLDFDGVLNAYQGWATDMHLTREPVRGSREFVKKLIEAGYDVVIYTCREAKSVYAWLRDNNFPVITVANHKPAAQIYIDDRGYRFDGDWEAAFNAIPRNPWWGSEIWTPELPGERDE